VVNGMNVILGIYGRMAVGEENKNMWIKTYLIATNPPCFFMRI
jgi:hypothetical protein